MPMRVGINTWVWTSPLTTAALVRLAPAIAEMGFDWIEVPFERPDDVNVERAAEIIRDLGLGVSAAAVVGPDRDLIHPDPDVRENGEAYVRAAIDAASTIGATVLIGPMYSGVGRTWRQTLAEREQDLDALTITLRRLAEHAHERGIVLGIEPLNRFETSFINLASQAIEVVDRVDHPACRMMLDTFHMNIEEKSAGDAIRAAGARLVHVHACENDRGAPGSGHVTWTEVAKALKDIKYDRAVVIESFTSQVEGLAQAAAIWRPLAKTQDDLARDGLTFLRRLLS
jgi:D-psicose/D-tagatose/L-ribulose 3-epimerase